MLKERKKVKLMSAWGYELCQKEELGREEDGVSCIEFSLCLEVGDNDGCFCTCRLLERFAGLYRAR